MLTRATDKAAAEGPVEVLVSCRELNKVVEGGTVHHDRGGRATERGVLEEDDLVVGVERHGEEGLE